MDIAFFLFPISVFYWELLLNISTSGIASWYHAVFMALFAITYSAIPVLLTTIFKKPAVNKALKAILLFVLSIPFIAVYFVYCEFQVFYDLNTMLSGAGGAVTDFFDDMVELIVNVSGFVHIGLFLLPFIVYMISGLIADSAESIDWKARVGCLGAGVLSFVVASAIIISLPTEKGVYSDEYIFGESVNRFGLCRSLTREVFLTVKVKTVGETVEFTYNEVEPSVAPEVETIVELSAEPSAEPSLGPSFEPVEEIADIVANEGETIIGFSQQPDATIYHYVESDKTTYGVNKLDIDFAALAQSEGTSKNLANLDNYVASQKASSKNAFTGYFKGKNLIFISAEAFCNEAVDPILTPTLYRMATRGIQFTDYYQPALSGTTGGEYHNIFGMLSTAGGSSVKNTQKKYNYMTLGTQLDMLGYTGKVYHNGSHTFYDRNLTHVNLGYSDGFTARGNGLEKIVTEGPLSSDVGMMKFTLPLHVDKQPFNLYYMSISGHSGYNRYSNSYANKYWDQVSGYAYTDLVKGYLSTQMEFDRSLEWTINYLEEQGIADDTVIVISADHFPYGLDSEGNGYANLSSLYGYSVTNHFERDHSRLIIWSGCLEKNKPIRVDEPTFSIDVLPTVLNLFGVDYDSRLLPGRDVFSDKEALVYSLDYNWKTSLGTYYGGKFKPKDDTVVIPDGYVDAMKTEVKNKITYMKGVGSCDYYSHVFGEIPDKYKERQAKYKPAAESTPEPANVEQQAEENVLEDTQPTVENNPE